MVVRIGPEGQLPVPDATEDGVELLLADEERIVAGLISPSWSAKSRVTSLPAATAMNGPKGTGSSSPRISLRKYADVRLSRAGTIVWLSCTTMVNHVLSASSQ